MRDRALHFLRCPSCGRSLELDTYDGTPPDDIRSGLLRCRCGEWYPIIRGVPRLLLGELRRDLILRRHGDFLAAYTDNLPEGVRRSWEQQRSGVEGSNRGRSLQRRTAESFGFEWMRFSKLFDSYRMNFLNYIAPVEESFFRGKVVLDAGCGQGRHAYWAAKFGAEVVAFDLGDAVEAAAANCRELPVHVVQADLYRPPFAPSSFDYIFSIGVLHHLLDPRKGFLSIVPLAKPGGLISIWVYGRRNNRRAIYLYEPLRAITRHLPYRLLRLLCLGPAALVEALNGATRLLARIPGGRGFAERLPFAYYTHFPFTVKWNDAFDVLATPRSTYWTEEELRAWFADAQLEEVDVLPLRKSSLKAFGRRQGGGV